jgi:replicative superfamily II helicase
MAIKMVQAGADWIPAVFPHLNLKYPKLNPVQAATLPYADKDVNLVVAAATSAGKTIVAEMAMASCLRPKEDLAARPKAIYLAPLKALASEKLDDWSDPSHGFSKLGVVLATGDTMFGPRREQVLKSCAVSSVLCLTSEMLDSLTRRMGSEKTEWLKAVEMIVVDETHMLAMEERGDKLESALMRFTSMNPKARLVLLSATMPNVEQIGEWAARLNGKETIVIQSDWRPVQLDISYPTYQQYGGAGAYGINKDRQIQKAAQVIGEARESGHRVLAFVHSKADGRALQRVLREEGETVEFHNADLNREERLEIESQFRDKTSPLGVIIATSTLAYGLNLPARVVVIVGTRRGMEPVHPYDIRQEVGRAGRFGIDVKGDAYIVLSEQEVPFERVRLEKLPPVSSQMEMPDRLLFHMTAEVAEGYHQSAPELWKWYRRSLASVRSKEIDQDEFMDVLDQLVKHNVIVTSPETCRLTATWIGKVSSWFYYHPLDVAGWFSNIYQLAGRGKKPLTDVGMAWALARVHTQMKTPYIPKPLQPFADQFRKLCWDEARLPIGNEAVIGYAYLLAITSTDRDLPEGWGMEVRGIRRDAERVAQAISILDSRHGKWGLEEHWETMGLRMTYGVSSDIVALVANLDGIGPEKAKKLAAAGLSSLTDVAKSTPAALMKIVGKSLGLSAWIQAKKLVSAERAS